MSSAAFSIAFKSSRPKSSMRAAKSRSCAVSWLYPMTAGIATTRPAAVVISASEMPGATARSVAAPAVPRPWKASMMPMTVPSRPMKGEMAAMVASQVIRCSIAVRASEEAVIAARSSAVGLRGRPRPPLWRWYSSLISVKTETSGLGRNWSATAEISERRPDLRKARRKPWLCLRARAKRRHLESMMAQENMLATSRTTSTAKATGPLLRTISISAPPESPTGRGGVAESS